MPFLNLYKNIIKGISVEREHDYINFEGQKSTFSLFVINSIKKLQKIILISDKTRLKNIELCFEQYEFDSMSGRMNSIQMYEKYLQELYVYFKSEEKRKEIKKKYDEKLKIITASKERVENIEVRYVKGVGEKLGQVFSKLGITTVDDLVRYYPKKYINYTKTTKISNLKIGENACIIGFIKNTGSYTTKTNLSVINVVISDDIKEIQATYFYKKANRAMLARYKAQFPTGATVMATGIVKIDSYTHKMALDKPQIEILSDDFDKNEFKKTESNIISIYPLTENLSQNTLRKVISNAYDIYKSKIKEFLPESVRNKHNLMNAQAAIKEIHFPSSENNLEKARFRLVYEEFFLLQLYLNVIKAENKKNLKSIALKLKKDGLVERFIKSLPYEFTNAQKQALKEIQEDLSSAKPMQRLLQGDVGSGKTVVACAMLLSAVENGYQGAIMAPTEILAIQHYKNFLEWLTPLNLSVGLFLGKHTANLRSEMQRNLKNGQMHIAIGTHALIQEKVMFKNLGAVVIDEQHRFGVKQRTKLLSKSQSPQMLTMTATPIPRTLALTLHGDLDITTLNELPKGRKPVVTKLITQAKMNDAYNLIKNEIKKGHQAYIVLPLIDESETISAKCAKIEAQELQKGIFKEYKIGLLHGKLKNDEKERVTNDFKLKKYDILVSTTVVEVGVDVPNATVMMIENSERFGLSQLHQLRGRVGRSSDQSYCLLTTSSSSKSVKDRFQVLINSNDGFYVAQKDLELRGPGEFLGTRQSGIPEFKIADIVKDAEILEIAREDSIEFLENNEVQEFENLKYEMDKKEILNNLKSG